MGERSLLFHQLAYEASQYFQLDVRNFVGSTYHIKNASGDFVAIDVENGDNLSERSTSRWSDQASGITAGARPHWRNFVYTFTRQLRGPLLGAFVALDDIGKTEDGYNWFERLRQAVATNPQVTRGISHTGTAMVEKDKETGLEMVWILDNYPNEDKGGIRIVGYHAFAENGPYIRFSRSRIDAKKFYQYVKSEIAKKGYSETGWTTNRLPDYEAGEVEDPRIHGKDKGVAYKVLISREEFERLHDLKTYRGSHKRWFAAFNRRMTKRIVEMGIRDGVGFDYGFLGKEFTAYCSSTPVIAALQTSGIDLQQHHDKYHMLVRFLNLLFPKGKRPKFLAPILDGIDFEKRIIAPPGLLVQPYVTEHKAITYPQLSVMGAIRAVTKPMSEPLNRELDTAVKLSGFNQRVKISRTIDAIYHYGSHFYGLISKQIMEIALEAGQQSRQEYYRILQQGNQAYEPSRAHRFVDFCIRGLAKLSAKLRI